MSVTRKYFALGEKPFLTTEQLAEIEGLKNRPIDLSDAPEETNWEGAVRGRFSQVRVPIESDIYAWLVKDGGNPQARINEILRHAMQA